MFPFGFPGPTAFYLTLYVLTLIGHVLFMNYVLAGTGYLAFVGVGRWLRRRTGSETGPDDLYETLRDWMPFALGAAITAAIAPLLFLQILYREPFYTANLLLFHRWMSILPVLIVGFYLLYLIRSKWMAKRSAVAPACAALGALACFAFTGYAWTENHLLSLDRASWPGHYESRAMVYRNPLVAARFLMWAAGSVATMATILGWQLIGTGIKGAGIKGLREDSEPNSSFPSPVVRRLAKLALAGIVISLVTGNAYFFLERSDIGGRRLTPLQADALSPPYSFLAVAGGLLQLLCWRYALRCGRFSWWTLGLASVGLLATLLGVTVEREAIRLHAIDISKLYEQHAEAAQIGGWWIFVFFAAVNAGLVVWAIRLVRRRSRVGGSVASE
ncbi:MAG TPA: hypothetical protein VJZ71_20580 [Phycisphaerae bacterium]|nr:hypothetical protein [Phycisphaerae bacterium]